ncbi:GNAT family N-acetyltransferase [Catenulispora yoronensis]|uniref:GNAT family N-acetyltransferase n=1 Tax=Catenulispora yoronensis TaxID=450799 RepID=A0ABN2V3X9_9ACTN
MNTLHSASGPVDRTVVVTRVAEHQWHALEDDQVVGRGEAVRRPDGRLFVGVDSWHEPVFRKLAAAMLAELPRPLFTVVDEGDDDLTAAWLVAGFSIGRRERGYVLPTDPRVSGLASVGPPSGVRIVPAGAADTDALRALDSVIRAEIAATVGWQTMPVEVLHRPHGILAEDLPKFVVAAQGTEYVGLVRLVTATRQPRIGLLAVRADHRRRGIARALLAHVLGDLHVRGTAAAWAEINEANTAAAALVEGAAARHTSTNLELVHQ